MNAPTGFAGALLDQRYRVGGVIAKGGMSVVYHGLDTRLDRPVAIKVMDGGMAADPAFRTRFEREARLAARIDHPAVVDVHDQGDGPDGALFLVMELVQGGTLRDVLRARGAVGVPTAFAVLEPVLAGLAEAHRLGMVHRDVKPENVLISEGGEVKVADFGLVTAAAQSGASHAGMIMGTLAYLSPEQVASGAADARSDVYSAGIVLYELLTGSPPYTAEVPITVALRHVNEDVPAPSLVAGDVPPELDELVLAATRRDPAARPPDAGAFLSALQAVRDRLGVPRVPVRPPVRPVEEQLTVPAARLAGPSGTRTMERPPAVADPFAADAATPAPPTHHAARRRSRRWLALWIAVVLVLGLAVAGTAWWLGTGRWTAMPSVVGLDRPAAEKLLADSDLVVTVTEEHHDSIASNVVAQADPAPQSRLLRGAHVTLTVSSGRPVVPAVAPGAAVAAAEQQLRDNDLTPVRSVAATEFSDSVPEGAVLRTDPVAGTALPIGAPVTLVLSKGEQPKTVEVPYVVGMRVKQATQALRDAGFDVETESDFPFGDRDNGRVVAQYPDAGESLPRGSTITLTVF